VLGEVQTHFIPQINLSIIFDENFITFLAVFFLLGGSEEEEDENFILEEEESDFIEDIVAPIFMSNLGKNVEDNGALFLKLNTVFAFVLFNNVIGMIPYSNTATSSLILTF
jgi:F0F1-type ATP synthase membrane subunit a